MEKYSQELQVHFLKKRFFKLALVLFISIVTSNFPVSFKRLFASIHITEHLVKHFQSGQGSLRLLFHIHFLMHHFDTLNIIAITLPNSCWSFRTTEHKTVLSGIDHGTMDFHILNISIFSHYVKTKHSSISTTMKNKTYRNSAFQLSVLSCQPCCPSFIREFEIWGCFVHIAMYGCLRLL